MKIEIPGYKILDLKYLVLDYNGTIAVDGCIPEEVKQRLRALSSQLEIYVLTADTHGTARKMCEDIPVTIMTFPGDAAMDEKPRILKGLGRENCAAVGNGRNDVKMCQEAELSVAIVGKEGACSRLVGVTDVCVASIVDALDLLLVPKRLIATLRG
ncbi:MAG: ATPase P [Ruminococcus sp.]|nr:ATPase P [Ruminococcus sp.]